MQLLYILILFIYIILFGVIPFSTTTFYNHSFASLKIYIFFGIKYLYLFNYKIFGQSGNVHRHNNLGKMHVTNGDEETVMKNSWTVHNVDLHVVLVLNRKYLDFICQSKSNRKEKEKDKLN